MQIFIVFQLGSVKHKNVIILQKHIQNIFVSLITFFQTQKVDSGMLSQKYQFQVYLFLEKRSNMNVVFPKPSYFDCCCLFCFSNWGKDAKINKSSEKCVGLILELNLVKYDCYVWIRQSSPLLPQHIWVDGLMISMKMRKLGTDAIIVRHSCHISSISGRDGA